MKLEELIKQIYVDLTRGYTNIAIERLLDSWETVVSPYLDVYYQKQIKMELVSISQRFASTQGKSEKSELLMVEGSKIVNSLLYKIEQLKEFDNGQNKPPIGRNITETVSLSKDEIDILAFMLTDVQAANRGVWLYPFQQQLTYRGYTDSKANSLLAGLKLKKIIEYIEIESNPLYKITDIGLKFIQDNQNLIPSSKDNYNYHIRLSGSKEENEILLNEIKRIEFVQNQTRFINEIKEGACKIAVWSYKELSRKHIEQIADIVKCKIISFDEIN